MTRDEAIQFLINSEVLKLWETNQTCDRGQPAKEIGNAIQTIEPSYHINYGCDTCIKEMLTKAVLIKNENKLTFHTFPKQ